jgi:uncharacterized protein
MVDMKVIRAVGRRIGREFSPRKVILFGSYAYGTPTEDSDVDLLIVMPFTGVPEYKSTEVLLKVRPPFPADILVRTPAAVRKRLSMGDGFMQEILERGKVLYEGDNPRVGGKGRGRLRNSPT